MKKKPWRICLGGPKGERCPEPVQAPASRCPKHERERASKANRVKDARYTRVGAELYNSRRWRMFRLQVLREVPWCQTPDCKRIATDVDHIIPLRDGVDPYDRKNVQSLCHPHHSAKTAREVGFIPEKSSP